MTYKLVFFGTSDFAVPSLEALAQDERFDILGIVTQPDRPVGRHAMVTASPLKQAALRLGITSIFQPEKLKDSSSLPSPIFHFPSCDAFVVVSYGKILPQWLLDIPRNGVINVHGSLLPRWRGPSPIQASIAAGDEISGITIMNIDAEMDHGPILFQAKVPIHPNDTGQTLHDRLAHLGGSQLPTVMADYLAGNIQPQEQDHAGATYCQILTRDDGKLSFEKTANELERLVRAYTPWPGTWMELHTKRLKVIKVRVGSVDHAKSPGERFVRDGLPCVGCQAGGVLEILELQPEGKQVMAGKTFLAGYQQAWNTPNI